jgi:hypothetical protein
MACCTVDDEHDVALGLMDQFDEDFCEGDAARCSQTVQLDAQADACRANVHALDPAQLLQQRRGGLREFGGRCAHRLLYERHRRARAVRP